LTIERGPRSAEEHNTDTAAEPKASPTVEENTNTATAASLQVTQGEQHQGVGGETSADAEFPVDAELRILEEIAERVR
jgi:hypothetical protein